MTEPLHILVADDEPSIRLLLETGLALNGFRVTSVRSGHEALAAAALSAYSFPGNVRELENALIRAAALAPDGMITLDCLPSHIAALDAGEAARSTVLEAAVQSLAADWPAMEELQRRYLQLALDKVKGNRRQAATLLGMNRRTIQRFIANHKIHAPPETDDDNDQLDEIGLRRWLALYAEFSGAVHFFHRLWEQPARSLTLVALYLRPRR